MKHFLITLGSVILIFGCQQSGEMAIAEKVIQEKEHPGKKLMESYCISCHAQSGNDMKRLAPPLHAVKNHYMKEGISKAEFTKAIVEWVANPELKHAKMHGAVNRFGLMAKNGFPQDDVQMIADYLYEIKLEPSECGDSRGKQMRKRRGGKHSQKTG